MGQNLGRGLIESVCGGVHLSRWGTLHCKLAEILLTILFFYSETSAGTFEEVRQWSFDFSPWKDVTQGKHGAMLSSVALLVVIVLVIVGLWCNKFCHFATEWRTYTLICLFWLLQTRKKSYATHTTHMRTHASRWRLEKFRMPCFWLGQNIWFYFVAMFLSNARSDHIKSTGQNHLRTQSRKHWKFLLEMNWCLFIQTKKCRFFFENFTKTRSGGH